MRRLVFFLILLISVFVLFSCSGKEDSKPPTNDEEGQYESSFGGSLRGEGERLADNQTGLSLDKSAQAFRESVLYEIKFENVEIFEDYPGIKVDDSEYILVADITYNNIGTSSGRLPHIWFEPYLIHSYEEELGAEYLDHAETDEAFEIHLMPGDSVTGRLFYIIKKDWEELMFVIGNDPENNSNRENEVSWNFKLSEILNQ